MSENICIIQGSDQPIEVQLMREKACGTEVPFDLTGNTEISAIFQNQDKTKLIKTKTSETITVENVAGGEITILFEESETENMRAGECQSFEIVAIINDKTYIWQLEKVLDIKARLC